MSIPPRAMMIATAVPGAALGAAALVTAALRRTKPLHPVGTTGEGTLTVRPAAPCGVPLLDSPGSHPCLVRWSRAMGLPSHWSDIEGLALRLSNDGRPADLLLASTGTSDLGRYLLTLRAPGVHGDLTTLLPVATANGPLVLRLRPSARLGAPASSDVAAPPAAYDLAWSRGRGPWRDCGVLRIEWHDRDQTTRFDPVEHPLPGTRQYPAVVALREPAYRLARIVGAQARPVRGG